MNKLEVNKDSLNEAQLLDFAERIGRSLRGGELIEFIGDVGAGKTTFVRGLARGLDVTGPIQSPTFTISRIYDSKTKGLYLAHYDFYRLNDAGIMAQEIDEKINDPDCVTVIEWGDVVSDILPGNRLTIEISSPSDSLRDLKIVWSSDKANNQLKEALEC